MCPARVRPERPERLVRLDAACASGRRFFFLMSTHWISLAASPYLLESSELLDNLVPLLLAVYDFLSFVVVVVVAESTQ